MVFKYKATTREGKEQVGTIEAASKSIAINSLQRRDLIVVHVEQAKQKSFLKKNIALFDHVSYKEIVILSRQIATLFEASVSVLNAFQLLSTETSNAMLQNTLKDIADDVRGGTRISVAMAKHPRVFSTFYVNMVKAGEESGKMSEAFNFLADYLERSYELTSKARNALIYPVFVIIVFIAVMILMMVVVIPQLSTILLEAGQDLPIYTLLIIWTSNFFLKYGIFLLVIGLVGGGFLFKYVRTKTGRYMLDQFKLAVPYVGNLYKKLYLSRISDNINTMLASGIPMLQALKITADVVDNKVYEKVLNDTVESVKGGSSVSDAFAEHPEIPQIIVQMMSIGEETGKLGFVLETMAPVSYTHLTLPTSEFL